MSITIQDVASGARHHYVPYDLNGWIDDLEYDLAHSRLEDMYEEEYDAPSYFKNQWDFEDSYYDYYEYDEKAEAEAEEIAQSEFDHFDDLSLIESTSWRNSSGGEYARIFSRGFYVRELRRKPRWKNERGRHARFMAAEIERSWREDDVDRDREFY